MALIKRLTVAPNLVFMARRNLFLACSAVLVAASVALFLVQGLNFGVDFRGGILIEVKTDGPADIGEMRGLLGGLGLGEVTLQEFGEPDDVLINVQRQEGEEAEQIQAIAVVKEALGERVGGSWNTGAPSSSAPRWAAS
jgi:preprotein translocase subunit SecF